ncbi:MAG: M48 family metalloprotease [Deltaproteobacteria bacterium]|nr:M48 family metalloprotease [Deltaproteobacteria bacterium]
MHDIYSQQSRNRRVTILLMLGFFIFVVLIGISVDVYTYGTLDVKRVPVATVFAVTLAGINGFVSYFYGSSVVLRSLGAETPVFEDLTHKRLHNVVTEMALASGLPMPRIYIINDPAPNAFATGRNPENSVVGVTQGLLDSMSREELQAVVAHEMGHIKSFDILTMTVVTVLVGTVSILSDWAVRTWRYGGIRPRRDVRSKGGVHPLALLVIALFVVISPVISRIIAMAVSRNREYQADASAAEFTRNPLALASALQKIGDATSPLRTARRGTAHLFISDPLKRKLDEKTGLMADVFSTHPPIHERVERLKKMAYVYGKDTSRGI